MTAEDLALGTLRVRADAAIGVIFPAAFGLYWMFSDVLGIVTSWA